MLKKLSLRHWILLAILILAAALRFYNYAEVSLSNDELSALNRLRFDSYGEVLNKGIKPDGHPAGVQLFLYTWTNIFGNSEASVRFPFVILGILSVLLSYLIASRWFGVSAGLMSAVAISCLEFPLLYSQIARPYMSGMFLSLLLVWFWTLLLFGDREGSLLKDKIPNWLKILGLSLSAAACMYNHYFSLLFAGVVLVSGILFIENENYKRYFLALVLTLVFFAPHIPLSIYQFTNVGDIGGWLPAPTPEWIPQHLFFISNNSVFVVLLVFMFISLSIARNFKNFQISSFHILAIFWFVTPFAIGYVFSIAKAPLLQNSVLLFSFPFLIFFCFSFFPRELGKFTIVALVGLGGVLCYSTVVGNKYYSTNHMGDMNQLALKPIEWANTYGEENITFTTNAHAAFYVDYYTEKYQHPIDFKLYKLDKDTSLRHLEQVVRESRADYFATGWSTKYQPPEAEQIIMDKFPFLIHDEKFNNTEVYLYAKQPLETTVVETPLKKAQTDFENWDDEWQINQEHLTELDSSSGKVYHLSSEVEYGPTLVLKVKDFPGAKKLKIRMKVKAETIKEQKIVVDVSHNGEGYQWTSFEFNYFLYPNEWGYVYTTVGLPEFKSMDDEIKIYPWNPGRGDAYIAEVKCEAY